MSLLQQLEEVSLNAWPALQQWVYDGWLIRLANGYTRRANSVNVLYPGTLDLIEKVDYCHRLYGAHGLPTNFRLTPHNSGPTLDRTLATLGFTEHVGASVQTVDLASINTEMSPSFRYTPYTTPQWEAIFHQLHGTPEKVAAHQAILQNITQGGCFAVLYQGEQPVACGLGVIERGFVGLFDVVTEAQHRRQGFGQQLVLSILDWAKQQGGTTAYLQVIPHNDPAVSLYANLGFVELYRYWYRTKDIS